MRSGRGRQPGAYKVDHLLDREAVGAHDRFGRTVAGGREQFERTATVRFGTTAGPWPRQYAMPWLGGGEGDRFVEAALSCPPRLRGLGVRWPSFGAAGAALASRAKTNAHGGYWGAAGGSASSCSSSSSTAL
jgi:hypothetical protein